MLVPLNFETEQSRDYMQLHAGMNNASGFWAEPYQSFAHHPVAHVSSYAWILGAARNLLNNICLIIFLLFLKENPMLREGEIA